MKNTMKHTLHLCLILSLLTVIFLLFAVPALGENARDLTDDCLFNDRIWSGHTLTDGDYTTYWESGVNGRRNHLEIAVPAGQTASYLYIKWRYYPTDIRIEIPSDGKWRTALTSDGRYMTQLIPLPGLTRFRLVSQKDTVNLAISELHVFTAGTLPDTVQQWEEPGDKVDMMVIAAHPDDEVLWFGGAIPCYAVRGKKVLVVCAAMRYNYRQLELLDCLWTCGVRIYPVFCGLKDELPDTVKELYEIWGGRDACRERFTGYYRRYRPDVVLLHDKNGEYGHTAHRAVSQLGRDCAPLAADKQAYPAQVSQYGTWDIPKVYVHLHNERPIEMDWWQPLDAFGGRTAQDVAREGFKCHQSQQEHGWALYDHGDYDNARFGLYRTRVGDDVMKNDFFENIPSPAEQ